jgi:hypothetical protein
MLVVIYAFAWLLVAAAAGILYLTGYFDQVMLTIFGFLVSTLFFAGVVVVLPWWVDKLYQPRY